MTYDTIIKKILGKKLGLFSSIIIFLHSLGTLLASWLHSFEFIFIGIKTIIYSEINDITILKEIKYNKFIIFNIFLGVGLFLFSFFNKVSHLRKLSMLTIVIILY